MSNISADILRELHEELAHGKFESLEAANAFLQARTAAMNDRPHPSLGDLSPHQVHRLLAPDWWEGPGLRLTRDLSADLVSHTQMIAYARTFLIAMRDRGPVAATATGNLGRSFVRAMLDEMPWGAHETWDVSYWQRKRAANERDVWPLHLLRLLLTLAGLLQHRRGFRITTLGRTLLAEDRVGELYALLFHTYFRKLNHAYADGLAEQPRLQGAMAFSFYQLRQMAATWVTPNRLAERVWLSTVTDPEPLPPYASEDPLAPARWRTLHRLITPFMNFGLLERRDLPIVPDRPYERPFEVCVTSLYDAFLHFDLTTR